MKIAAVVLLGVIWASTSFAQETAKSTPEGTYKKFCSSCHDVGVGGAPKLGDKAQWAPRIARGQPTLLKTAIEGSKTNPLMLARAGTKLTDAELDGVVGYMISKAK